MAKKLVVRTKKNLNQDESGATGVLFALLAVPLFAMTGMAIEYARVLNSRESMQQSLDAAVLAARNAPSNEQAAVAQKFFKTNLKKVIADATADFGLNSEGDLEGSGVAYVRTPIAGMVNHGVMKVTAYALARSDQDVEDPEAGSVTPCIHVMDQSGAKTFWLDSNSNFTAAGCQVRVRSNNSAAMYETSSSSVKFQKVLVKGGASINSGYGLDKFYVLDGNHQVTTNAQVVGNPYDVAMSAVSRQINSGACTTANTGKIVTGVANPGTFCGATEFKNVTFNPGIYVIKSGSGNKTGALKLSGLLNGNAGVTFFFADNKSKFVSYTGSAGSVMKAPTSGVTRGVLFMESSNRGNNYDLAITSVSNNSWTGMVYFPSMNLTLDSLSGWPVLNIALAANQLKLKSVSSTLTPYAWTPYGYDSPIALEGEVQTSRRHGWLME